MKKWVNLDFNSKTQYRSSLQGAGCRVHWSPVHAVLARETTQTQPYTLQHID